MPNSLQYASVFQSELDKAAVELANLRLDGAQLQPDPVHRR